MIAERPELPRFVRVRAADAPGWGRVDGDRIVLRDRPPWEGGGESAAHRPLAGSELLVPSTPSKIVCVGLNYRAHVAESASAERAPDEPVLFLKPPSSLLAPGRSIRLPPESERVDHEAEMAVVLGRRLRNASPAEAEAAVFGVTALNDVTARDLQRRDRQWTRAKGFDTFCPLGPCLAAGLDPGDLTVRALVNDEERQRGRTRDLLVGVPELIAFASRVMTLEAGDVLATGTPAGVGPLVAGDRVEIEVEGVGRLVNPVRTAGDHGARGGRDGGPETI